MTIAPARGTTVRPRAPLMTAARAVGSGTTNQPAPPDPPAPVDGSGQRRVSGDPLDALVERIRPVAAHAVDPLQLAALLEADGLTDRAARVEYGFDDVFAAAEEAFRRLAPGPPPAPPVPVPAPAWRSGRRDIAHGLLYLMPSALFPAVLAAVGRGPLVTALVLAGGLGWAWSGGASWLAYRRLGAGDPAGAARALGGAVLLGLPVAAALGAGVAGVGAAGVGEAGAAGGWGGGPAGGAGAALIALCLAQMAFQLASMLLVFYRREGLLAVVMAPAVLAGCGYVLAGGPATAVAGWPPGGWSENRWPTGGWLAGHGIGTVRECTLAVALVLGAASIVTALLLGLRAAVRAAGGWTAAGKRGTGFRAGLRADLPGAAWATAYAAFSAAYLLHAQARYLDGPVDVALAAAPLLAGMGVVEWQARRFGEHARAALARVNYPRQLAWRVWSLLAGGVAVSTGVVAVLAVALLVVLDRAGLLGRPGVLMAAAHAVLAGAYFLSFLLAGQGRYPVLCATVLTAGAVHTLGGRLLGAGVDPLADTGLFLASALLLQLLCAVLLARTAAQPWRYR